jgi:hypothetical protein
LLDKRIENYGIMPLLEVMGFKGRNFGGFSQDKEVKKPFLDRGKSTA